MLIASLYVIPLRRIGRFGYRIGGSFPHEQSGAWVTTGAAEKDVDLRDRKSLQLRVQGLRISNRGRAGSPLVSRES